MSRVGKRPIEIPAGTKVEIAGAVVTAAGPLGTLTHRLARGLTIRQEEETLHLERSGESDRSRALHGLNRTLVANMVQGVSVGFQKKLEIVGVGYRVEQQEKALLFKLGYSHDIVFQRPKGITFTLEKNTAVIVSGPDKALVGQVAASIRGLRKPEPYKGKGIRYADEQVRRKAGKTAV